jgi:hypothetical protein
MCSKCVPVASGLGIFADDQELAGSNTLKHYGAGASSKIGFSPIVTC